jgi:putative peptidoglycan lipid II flippase
MQETEDRHIVINAAKFSGGLMISRLLGLGRDMLLAYVLGGGWVADIFLAAFRIPNFVRRVFYEGALYMPFLPLFNSIKLKQGKEEAFAFARAVIFRVLILALILALLCKYASHAIALLLVPGFAAESGLLTLAGSLMEITFFYLPFVALATLLACMALAFEHYIATSISPACLNLTMIFAGLYAWFGGHGGYEAARIFCYGVLAGGVLQVLIQLPAMYREGFRFFGKMSSRSAEARSFSIHAPQAVFGASFYQAGAVVAMLMASFLGEGNVSALYFAERILEFPLAFVGIALSTASMSNFTALVVQERKAELTLFLRRVLSLGLCFSLPATFGLIALAAPVSSAIFGHGSFSSTTLERTTSALIFYAPLLPAAVMSRPLLAVLNAGGKSFSTMCAALLSLGVLVLMTLLLFAFLDLEAVAISASAAAWVSVIFLLVFLARARVCEPGLGFFPWKSFVYYLIFSAIMFAALQVFMPAANACGLGRLPVALIGVPLGAIIFFILCRVFYRQDLTLLRKTFFDKNHKF